LKVGEIMEGLAEKLEEKLEKQSRNQRNAELENPENVLRKKDQVKGSGTKRSKASELTDYQSKVNVKLKGSKNDLAEDLNVLDPLPDFQFNQLSRPIHWERLNGLNLERIARGTDITTLMTCVDDVALGDASQEDIDHKLLKTLNLSQYSVQYLLSCQSALSNNKALIKDALRVFDDEEALLDLKLAKMRSRSKALKRENNSLDVLHTEYADLLLTIDPLLSKAYKKSLHISNHPERYKKERKFVKKIAEIAETSDDDPEVNNKNNKKDKKDKNGSKKKKTRQIKRAHIEDNMELRELEEENGEDIVEVELRTNKVEAPAKEDLWAKGSKASVDDKNNDDKIDNEIDVFENESEDDVNSIKKTVSVPKTSESQDNWKDGGAQEVKEIDFDR
jgi:hypothetical protein